MLFSLRLSNKTSVLWMKDNKNISKEGNILLGQKEGICDVGNVFYSLLVHSRRTNCKLKTSYQNSKALTRRHPEAPSKKWTENNLTLIHDNAPTHRSRLVRNYLAKIKNSVTMLEHPPHLPDFAPTELFLFPRLKTMLMGKLLKHAEVVKQNAKKW